jgi:hypothetical protein
VAVNKRRQIWDRHNDRAYAYLVVACDSQQSPMEVVYAHAAAVAALPEGAPGAGQDPTAARLLSDLAARFSQKKNIGVGQVAIAEFHSLAHVLLFNVCSSSMYTQPHIHTHVPSLKVLNQMAIHK